MTITVQVQNTRPVIVSSVLFISLNARGTSLQVTYSISSCINFNNLHCCVIHCSLCLGHRFLSTSINDFVNYNKNQTHLDNTQAA